MTRRAGHPVRCAARLVLLACLLAPCALGSLGCATIRTTDPPRTATEQFLLSVAAARAIEQLSAEALRDRKLFIDTTYLGTSQTAPEYAFMVGEMRAKLLLAGVRLVQERKEAQVILEVRSGGISIDRLEYLLGIPALYVPQLSDEVEGAPLATPELAILKTVRQKGYAGIAYIAYWADTGEVVASSGPFVGRTIREDFWIFGFGPRTIGNIPTTEK